MHQMQPGTATLLIRATTGEGSLAQPYEVRAGQSIQDGVRSAGLSSLRPWVAVVNGVTEDIQYILQPGDVVQLLPQIVGG